MNAENRSMLNGGVSLLDVPLIEHGREVNGWLLFRIPADVLINGLSGSIKCRDYLEHRFSIGFVATAPLPDSGSPLKGTVK
jgi:hypothetical protein